jgi:hypothetical protein
MHGARSVAVSYKPPMLVTRVRLPACAHINVWVNDLQRRQANLGSRKSPRKSPHWGLNPGPSVYKTDALPLSYRGLTRASAFCWLRNAKRREPTQSCLQEIVQATARGFEPLRAEPNGFLVHHLNHSVTLSARTCTKQVIYNQMKYCARNIKGHTRI